MNAKSHRWNDVGEKCLDCGDSDWMNDPVCRPRSVDPDYTATPSIAVNPSASTGNSLVPVDVLDVIDLEIAALSHEVNKGNNRLRGTVHDLRDAHAGLVELFEAHQILYAMAKSREEYFVFPDGWDLDRLDAALPRVKGEPA